MNAGKVVPMLGAVGAVGNVGIPPNVGVNVGANVGANVVVGGTMNAGNAAAVVGTVGVSAAIRAVGHRDIPPVGKVGGTNVGVINAVRPGAVGTVVAVVTGEMITAELVVAIKHTADRAATAINRIFRNLITKPPPNSLLLLLPLVNRIIRSTENISKSM